MSNSQNDHINEQRYEFEQERKVMTFKCQQCGEIAREVNQMVICTGCNYEVTFDFYIEAEGK